MDDMDDDGDNDYPQPATQLDMNNMNIRVDELFSQLRDAQTVVNNVRANLALLGSGDNATTTSSAFQIILFNTMLSMGDTMNDLRESIRFSNVRIASLEHSRSYQR
eukprot:13835651-Heterocapsa_arctica.AAC.1